MATPTQNQHQNQNQNQNKNKSPQDQQQAQGRKDDLHNTGAQARNPQQPADRDVQPRKDAPKQDKTH